MWDYLEPLALMIDTLTVVHRFDQRGCGGSDPSPDHRIDRYCADIEALRTHWGHEAMVVIGHSFGATLALAYTIAHPRRVITLGYLSGVGIGNWQKHYRARRETLMSPQQAAQLRELKSRPERGPAEEIEFRTLAWFTDHADRKRAWEWAHEDALTPHRLNDHANRALNAEADAWTATTLPQQAGCLEVDTMFIHGSHDPRPYTSAQELATLMPRGRMVVVDGAGHHIWRERPKELRAHLHKLCINTV